MAETRIYYVICEDNCKFESMTKEQIIAAIAEVTGKTPTDVDAAFITKIKEQNANKPVKIWVGTQAEFNALTEKDENTLYYYEDTDLSDLTAAFENILNGTTPVAEATHAATATSANNASYASNSGNASTATSATRATYAKTIESADGSRPDIVIGKSDNNQKRLEPAEAGTVDLGSSTKNFKNIYGALKGIADNAINADKAASAEKTDFTNTNFSSGVDNQNLYLSGAGFYYFELAYQISLGVVYWNGTSDVYSQVGITDTTANTDYYCVKIQGSNGQVFLYRKMHSKDNWEQYLDRNDWIKYKKIR